MAKRIVTAPSAPSINAPTLTAAPNAAMVQALEDALAAGEREEARLRANLAAVETGNRQIRHTLAQLRRTAMLTRPKPAKGSVTTAIRNYLAAVPGPQTVKEIEHHLVALGLESGEGRFYWKVNGSLRAMADVVMVIHPEETSRFALRTRASAWAKTHQGWRVVELPRRTSLASRQAKR